MAYTKLSQFVKMSSLDSSVSCRVVVPCYKDQDDTMPWPPGLSNFGIETPGRLQFKGHPVGKYSIDPNNFIGIVAPDEYQHNPPLEYKTSGYTVRWITITIDGSEEGCIHNGTSEPTLVRLYVSPHSPGKYFIVEA